MNARKEIKTYFEERVRNIDHSLKELKHSFAPENFHQLRVEIKKTKALFKLVSFYSKKFDFDHFFKPYRTLFAEAGKVRELQIEEALFRKNKDLKFLLKYRTQLKELRLKEQIIFCRKVDAKLLKDLKRSGKAVFPFLKKITKNTIHDYAHENWSKIKRLACKQKLMTNEIHKLRKKLKSLYYLKEIGEVKDLKKELKGMKDLMEIMGQWHDKLVTGEHLQKTIRSAEMKTRELKVLNKLKTKLSEERKLLYQNINKEIKVNC